MTCPACGAENRDGARFCGECAASLVKPVACPSCGATNPGARKFCDACGASLAVRPANDAVVRKVVTIVFADLIASTALHERLDPESVRRVMDRYHRAVRVPVEAYGGTVVQLLGDGVMCAFGVPRVAEDDAIRAVRAAVGIQRAFQEFAREERAVVGTTGLRVAVNTGEVVVSDEHPAGIGDPLNVAARLQQEAHDGDVVIGEATHRLVSGLVTVAPLGALALKGRTEAVAAYRVVSLERPAGTSATAFVGRDDELRRLAAVYDAAVTTPAGRLAVILGSPGLGKSRLLDEFARRLGDGATVLTAHCDAAGGATFAPIARALRTLLRIDDGSLAEHAANVPKGGQANTLEWLIDARHSGDAVRAAIDAALPREDADRGRIASGIAALLAATPGSPEETFFVVRRFLAALASTRPVVLAIDDLHWAQPLLLDLVEHLVQWGAGVPLLVVAAARPELRDVRSSLASTGGLVADVVTLAGLDAGAATRLAASVIGADELPAAVAGRVLTTSEGNPLFVGELVRMLVNDGALKREGDRWTAGSELAHLEMPPTIHALLAARIERLRPEERTVLERAAVVGRQFSRAAVAHLLPRDAQGDLDARLEALRRSEIIERDAGWFLGEPALRFHHVLTRDAAYRRVLKGTRAELHARFADWLEARVGEAVEHDETLGWHLEQAHQHLRELGPIDERGRALGDRAARYLAAAGRRALARDDLAPAASLLGRALDQLDKADPARADLALDWCEALLESGDVGTGARAIAELARFTHDSDRLRAWHTCFAGQLAVLTDPQTLRATADAVAAAANELATAGDAAGEAKGHLVHALALSRLGQVGACEAALDKALAAARRADDRRRANTVLAGAPVAALWGPSPVTRASGRCLDVVRVLRITRGAPAVEAVALRCQAVLEALRGRTDAARRMIASSRRMVEELGITQQLLEADVFAGLIDLLEGDAVAAERALRPAYDGLREQGLGIDAARAAAFLGRALLIQGRAAEAEALSKESEALAGDDLQATITWRGVRAEALARRGEHAAGIDFARTAVDIAAATDGLLHHADARLALAAALRAAGRHAEADAERARAIELWEAKGATLLAERARRAAPRADPVERPREDRPAPAHTVHRQVRANAATAMAARLVAAVATRNADALATLHANGFQTVHHHPTGVVYDREGILASWRALLQAQGGTLRIEPLATLGDSLALCRQAVSGSGFAGRNFDVGAYETEGIALIEVDARGQYHRIELFASDRLGDAIVRLYERYAELLPDGPARVRAAATARSVATVPLVGARDLDREATAFAPGLEYVDHRTVGMGSVHGADALLRAVRALLDLSETFVTRSDDVLALRPDGFLIRWTHFGTDRASGGAFERRLCHLWIFGVDGLVTRAEQFDAERDAEALARFDELTAEPAAVRFAAAPPRVAERRGHRVRANAATAIAARDVAAFAARNADALAALYADGFERRHHPTSVVFDREGALASWRALLKAQGGTFRLEPLATLGDSLALCRESMSGSGFVGRTFDVGAYEIEDILLLEVDAHGQHHRDEVFAADRLGDAVARLYERYADLLPDGPARVRAAATARSVAALQGPFDLDRFAVAFAPTIEAVDHRTLGTWSACGAEALLGHFRSLLELADGAAGRLDEVLDLRSDASLVRQTHFGTARGGGGAYERPCLMLQVFGTDGLVSRIEWFDPERDDEALVRFDALTAEPATGRLATTAARTSERHARHIRSNDATANAARFDAAMAARAADDLPMLFTDEYEVVDHTTGVTFDRKGALFSLRFRLSARDPTSQQEPLATLGDSLALCHWSMSASGFAGGTFDVGAYETAQISLVEVDAQGRRRRTELFATYRLGDAVARLYERYADLLPDGPERARAAATARAIAAVQGFDLDRFGAALEPAVEFVDHRSLGFPATSGAEAYLRRIRSMTEVADDVTTRVDDVLRLRSDAVLLSWTTSGTDRAGGGRFERPFFILWVFGADGRVARNEMFDIDRDAEALARFDVLAAEPVAARFAAAPPRLAKKRERRVRPNAATAHLARMNAAIAARDADAFPTLLADEYQMVEHMAGVTYDRQGELSSFRSLLSARNPTARHEPVATLGDSLSLGRFSASASGFADDTFDVGAYEIERIALIEVDAEGRRRRAEMFAVDRLGDAIARLYERHADLLPDGPARARAAATARSVAAIVGPFDVGRLATAVAPAIESVDHRILGTWSARGAEALLQHYRSVLELADDVAIRDDEILALRSDALLTRRTHLGTARAGGGAYEREYLALSGFGVDGLVKWNELFDCDREADALARFDELTGEPVAAPFAPAPPRAAKKLAHRVRPNAATAHAARVDAAIAARDADVLPTLFPDESEIVDHTTRTTWDRQGALFSYRALLSARDPTVRHEPLATLGDSLALCRWSASASGYVGQQFDVGAYERDVIYLIEVDTRGRHRRDEVFAPDRLGDAVARLYARHAELLPDGPVRDRAAATARSVAAAQGSVALDVVASSMAPDVEFVDHRLVGLPSSRGRDAYLRSLGSLFELVESMANRVDDILGLRADVLLRRITNMGTERTGGGTFERPILLLAVFGTDGLVTHWEFFDPARATEALARFDELTPEPPPTTRITNAATRSWNSFREAWEARDWDRVAAIYAPGFRLIDRRPMVRLDLDRDGYLQTMRLIFEMSSSRFTANVLATRGERLLLFRVLLEGTDRDVGPSEVEWLAVVEVDDAGDRAAMVHLDPDDLDGAYAELDRRYAAGEAAPYAAGWQSNVRFLRAVAARDWEQLAATFAPDFVLEDHRPIGLFGSLSADQYVASVRALLELRPDARFRMEHVLALDDRRSFNVGRWVGGEAEGTFEIPVVNVVDLGPAGVRRWHFYNLDQLEEARARFDALGADGRADDASRGRRSDAATRDPLPALVRPNAASAEGDRWHAAFAARDWAAMRALCAPDATFEDRRRLVRVSGDVDWWIADAQRRASMPNVRIERQLVGTAGDRVALERFLLTGDPGGAAAAFATESRRISSVRPFEIEFLWVGEVDESGRLTAGVVFDVDDWRAATREAYGRWFARDAVAAASVGPAFGLTEAFNERDRTRMRAVLANDFVLDDHRPARLGVMGADAYVESCTALSDLAPDAQMVLTSTLSHDRYGSVKLTRNFGTLRDGGTFDNPTVSVSIVADGRMTRLELFEPEHVDAALARFAELRPNPLRIPPNSASRAGDRLEEMLDAQDWDALGASCAPAFMLDDRRPFFRLTGDRDMLIAIGRYIASVGFSKTYTLLATAGDRLALWHFRWFAASDVPDAEVEALIVREVDAEGRLVAVIAFDPDDRRAASAELFERYARSDAARVIPAAWFEMGRALHDHDLERCRAALPRDFVFHDHRRMINVGRLEVADEYIASLAALFEQSSDLTFEILYIVAAEKHGSLAVGRTFGTLADGGGEFESLYVRLARYQGDQYVGNELFELEDLDVARARFEELRPDPLRIPPDAAARTRPRQRTRRGARVARIPCARKR